jgi:hypothetical protein
MEKLEKISVLIESYCCLFSSNLQVTLNFSAVDFANYFQYKLPFLALFFVIFFPYNIP